MRTSTAFAAIILFLGSTVLAQAEGERRPSTTVIAFIEAIKAWPGDIQKFYDPIAETTGEGSGLVTSFSAGPDLRSWQLIETLGSGPSRMNDPWIGHYDQAGSYDDTDWYGLSCYRFGKASKPLFDQAIDEGFTLNQGINSSAAPTISAGDAFRMLVGVDMSGFFWISELSDVEVATNCDFVMTFAGMTTTDAAHDLQEGLVDLLGEDSVSLSNPQEGVFSIDITYDARNSDQTKIEALEIFIDDFYGRTSLSISAHAYRTHMP